MVRHDFLGARGRLSGARSRPIRRPSAAAFARAAHAWGGSGGPTTPCAQQRRVRNNAACADLGEVAAVVGDAPAVLEDAPAVLGDAPEVLEDAPAVLGDAPAVLRV